MPAQAETNITQYELEVEIQASPQRVWETLTESTDAWWLPDFRTVSGDSVVHFDATAGGTLIERNSDGESLLWYTVQMVVPGKAIYLVGHTAPDWGGPSLSMMKLAIEERADGCALLVSDSLLGVARDEQATGMADGWRQLFTDGLKRLVEA